MKKVFPLILVFMLLSSQFGLSAIGQSIGTEQDDFRITVEPNSTTEQAVIRVSTIHDVMDRIELSLPDYAKFDEEMTKELSNDSITITYDKENHKVILHRVDGLAPLDTKIALINLTETDNVIHLRGNINGEMTDFKEYAFSIPRDTIMNNETAQEEKQQIDKEQKVSESESNKDNKQANQRREELEKEEEVRKEETKEKEKVDKVSDDTTSSITPFAGNLNVDIDISSQKDKVLAGNDAAYNLVLKVTGARTEYTDAKVTVVLPIKEYTEFAQDVSELVIDGVTPMYDEANHTLTYEFESLKSGQTYETLIKINTLNGLSPDGAELMAEAKFEANEQAPISDEATLSIDSSSAISVSKQFLEVQGNDRNLPYPNSNTLWEIKVDIPKNDTGQMFVKETSQITVTDTLPSGLTYVSTEIGPEPTQSGNKLTWTFDAASIEEQKDADDKLFSTTIRVLLKVEPGTVDTTQENSVHVEAKFINDEMNNSSANDTITIVDSDTANGDIEGSWYIPNHFGPSNGSGGVGNSQNRNPNPVVYDDALLQFRHGIAPLPESEHGDFEQYTTSYKIDPNLIFKELKTPGGFVYRPNSDYPNGIPLQKKPVFNIKAMVNGSERLLVEDANIDQVYTRSDLGLEKTDEVSVIYYEFTTAPAGMLNVGVPQYYFEVKPGYIGEVKNEYDIFGINGAGESFANEYNSDPLAGPRTAQIAPRPESQPPTATVHVELLDHENSEVTSGDNRMKVVLNNIDSSTLTMQGPLETVVLLPAGVRLKDDPNPDFIDGDGRSSLRSTSASGGNYEVYSDDYNGSGRQLIKINWNDERLRIGNNLAAELDVTILNSAPNSLQFDVYGFSGDDELRVPSNSGSAITDTVLQTDEEDLNGDGITEQPRLKSGNLYMIRGQYNIQTEKLVKGELDDDYSSFGQTIPEGSIDYRLKLTNTTGQNISRMTIIDVLPSIGDLGITDNIERGSQFTPEMKDSIVLPAEWQDKVNVLYSTAKNPERNDLTRNTDYPATAEQLTNPDGAEDPNWLHESEVTDWSSIHSFKIELKGDAEWIEGEDITIEFSMQAPSENEVSREVLDSSIDPTARAAWNSFAVATDHGQPVEPLRVGVYMDYDIEDPTVEKTVNDQKEPVELINQEEQFTWKVDYAFGNYTTNWESVVFSDQIHELLDIEDVQVVNQFGEDVTENGTLDITDNLVMFTLNKQDESFSYLKGQTYTLIIDSKIKSSATEEELEPFIQSGGIPNTAELIVDDEPTHSNEVKIKPPKLIELTIIKVDKLTRETLQGAEFELRKCSTENSDLDECTLINSGISDENGVLYFEDLQFGSYKLVETKAPEDYRILKQPILIELDGEENQVEIEVENSKNGWELPKTGGIGTLVFYFIGATLMYGTAFILLRRRAE